MIDELQDLADDPDARLVDEARALLHRFTGDTSQSRATDWIPAWSSRNLERTLEQIVSAPGGRVYHLLRGFWELLARTDASLSDAMQHFIKDVVVGSFTAYRGKYADENFDWMVAAVNHRCTAAQAWFAIHAMPEPWLSTCRARLLSTLEGSPLYERARLMSEPD